MRTKSTGGFTLIELLIVIAIIGILAAVLIPNLMNARTTAAQRAAQAHSANVYTATMASLAEHIQFGPGDIDVDCEGGGVITLGTAPDDVETTYSVNAAPANTSCEVGEDAGDVEVTVVYDEDGGNERTYINGVQQ